MKIPVLVIFMLLLSVGTPLLFFAHSTSTTRTFFVDCMPHSTLTDVWGVTIKDHQGDMLLHTGAFTMEKQHVFQVYVEECPLSIQIWMYRSGDQGHEVYSSWFTLYPNEWTIYEYNPFLDELINHGDFDPTIQQSGPLADDFQVIASRFIFSESHRVLDMKVIDTYQYVARYEAGEVDAKGTGVVIAGVFDEYPSALLTIERWEDHLLSNPDIWYAINCVQLSPDPVWIFFDQVKIYNFTGFGYSYEPRTFESLLTLRLDTPSK